MRPIAYWLIAIALLLLSALVTDAEDQALAALPDTALVYEADVFLPEDIPTPPKVDGPPSCDSSPEVYAECAALANPPDSDASSQSIVAPPGLDALPDTAMPFESSN